MEDVILLVSPKAFQGMVNPVIDPGAQAASTNVKIGAVVSMDKSDTLQFGSSGVVIRGNQGKIEVVPHLFVKEGEAFAFPVKCLKRVGSTDVTFNTPGRGDEFFIQLQDRAGYELRAYANQALFCNQPGRMTKYYNIA